jgi:simple sugar transport system permease protein
MGKKILFAVAAPVAALLIAFIVCSVTLLISGHNPFEAYRVMGKYLGSVDSLVNIINRAVPYYVAGLAVAIGFKMNLFNIGTDGQYRLAALFAAAWGAELALPGPLHVLAILVIAVSVGAGYAGIAGLLKVKRGVNEVVSTIMLNYIATGITAYALQVYLRDRHEQNITQTKMLPRSGWLPPLNRFFAFFGWNMPKGTVFQGFLPIAIALGIGFYILVWRTRFGYDLRATGINPAADRAAGVDPNAMILKTILISGGLAGLIGAAPLLSDLHLYGDQFPTTIAFTGIAVALLGRNHPVGVALAALLWATIERGTQILATINVSQEISKILQGTILLAAVIAYAIIGRLSEAAAIKEAAAKAQAHHRPIAPVAAVPT